MIVIAIDVTDATVGGNHTVLRAFAFGVVFVGEGPTPAAALRHLVEQVMETVRPASDFDARLTVRTFFPAG